MSLDVMGGLSPGKVALDREARERLQSLVQKSGETVLSRIEAPSVRVETSGSLAALAAAKGNALMAMDGEWASILSSLPAQPLPSWARLEQKLHETLGGGSALESADVPRGSRAEGMMRVASAITRLGDAFDLFARARAAEDRRPTLPDISEGAAQALARAVQDRAGSIQDFLRQRVVDLQQNGVLAAMLPERADGVEDDGEPMAAEADEALSEAARARKGLSQAGAALSGRRQQAALEALI